MNKLCRGFKTDLQAFEQSQPLDKIDESSIRMTLTSDLCGGEELLATTLGNNSLTTSLISHLQLIYISLM